MLDIMDISLGHIPQTFTMPGQFPSLPVTDPEFYNRGGLPRAPKFEFLLEKGGVFGAF